jgi:predicted helicase
MSMADRQRVLARLKEPDRPTVVTNARCLTEGIDVPSLDAVALIEPSKAAVDIVQAVGRVMRTAPDMCVLTVSTIALIIIPRV